MNDVLKSNNTSGMLDSEKIKSIKEKYLKTPPVDLVSMAEELGFTIAEINDDNDDFSGAIYVDINKTNPIKVDNEDKYKVIIINKKNAASRQRFTLAHELAHYFNDCLDKDGNEKNTYKHRDGKNRLDPREIKINEYAAELIMPLELLYKDITNELSNNKSNEVDLLVVKKLANKYQVSLEAMRNRINWIWGFNGRY